MAQSEVLAYCVYAIPPARIDGICGQARRVRSGSQVHCSPTGGCLWRSRLGHTGAMMERINSNTARAATNLLLLCSAMLPVAGMSLATGAVTRLDSSGMPLTPGGPGPPRTMLVKRLHRRPRPYRPVPPNTGQGRPSPKRMSYRTMIEPSLRPYLKGMGYLLNGRGHKPVWC